MDLTPRRDVNTLSAFAEPVSPQQSEVTGTNRVYNTWGRPCSTVWPWAPASRGVLAVESGADPSPRSAVAQLMDCI